MYSQYDEEKAILNFFGDKRDGSFLDLGAYDGKTFSNTFALAERGWSGVCIEASPQCFVAMQKTYRANHNVRLLCAAVSELSGVFTFHDSGGAVASLNDAHYEKWKNNQKDFMDISVMGITPAQVLTSFGKDFNFVSIDLEGITMNIFSSLCLTVQPSLWCVEAMGEERTRVKNLLTPLGYRFIHQTEGNVLWGK